MIPVLQGLLALCSLGLLTASMGRRLCRWLNVRPAHAVQAAALYTGLGLGVFTAILFSLFAVGIGTSTVIRAAWTVYALLSSVDALAILRSAPRLIRKLKTLDGLEEVVAVSLSLLLGIILIRAVCPPVDGDAIAYHLTASTRYLAAGRYVFLPTITHSNWPVAVETLFTSILAWSPTAPTATVQFLFGIVALAACSSLVYELGGRRATAMTLCLLMAYGGFWDDMRLSYVDMGLCAYAMLSVLAFYRGCQQRDQAQKWYALSAVFAGCAAGCKLTGLWVIAAMTLLAICQLSRDKANEEGDLSRNAKPGTKLLPALRFLLIASIVATPWFLRTWALTGNPIYPALYRIFGGLETTAAGYPRLHEFYLRLNTPPGMPPTPSVLFWSHFTLAVGGWLIALLVWRSTRKSTLAIPARFAAFLFAWVLTMSIFNLRFLLAAIPPVAICAGFGIARRWPRLVPGFVCVAIPLCVRGIWREKDIPDSMRFAFGAQSREEYQRERVMDYGCVEYANTNLYLSARILSSTMVNNTALYHPQAFWGDCWTQDAIHYDTPEQLKADINRFRITHIVVQEIAPEWCPKSHTFRRRAEVEWPMLRHLASAQGRLLVRSGDTALYELNNPAK